MQKKSLKSHKKITNTNRHSSKRYLYLGLILLLSLVLITILKGQYDLRQTKASFNWANSSLDSVKKEIDSGFGTVQDSRISKYCYYGDSASAYDKGFLRCRTELSGKIASVQPDIETKNIKDIAEQSRTFAANFESRPDGFNGNYIEGQKITCGHDIENSRNYNNLNPEQIKEGPQIIYKFYCDRRVESALYKIK